MMTPSTLYDAPRGVTILAGDLVQVRHGSGPDDAYTAIRLVRLINNPRLRYRIVRGNTSPTIVYAPSSLSC